MADRKKRTQRNRIKRTAGCILLAAGFALAAAARLIPRFADWYASRIYPVWVGTLGRAAGVFPFSVSEALLYALLSLLAGIGARLAIRRWNGRLEKGETRRWAEGLLVTAALLFFLYMANCGVNYYRESFAERNELGVEEYTVEELKQVCLWLTEEVNALGGSVERDADGRMVSGEEVENQARQAMAKLGEMYPELQGYYPRAKGLLNPWILSVQKLTGIYSPFTVEANYNTKMVEYNIPFTVCHELSHLRGFMQEEEANFIAFLACRTSGEAAFGYSGNLLGWIHCMNVLYETDYEAWEEVRSRLAPEMEADLQANNQFWSKYDGRVAEVADQINDRYLKANGQKEGVRSYDRMTDLIVAWYLEGNR